MNSSQCFVGGMNKHEIASWHSKFRNCQPLNNNFFGFLRSQLCQDQWFTVSNAYRMRHIGWPKTQNDAQNTMLPSVSAFNRLRSTSVRVIKGTCIQMPRYRSSRSHGVRAI